MVEEQELRSVVEDYASTVLKYAQEMSQQGRRISILDLCTGKGGGALSLLERLIANEIDFEMLMVEMNPYILFEAIEHIVDLRSDLPQIDMLTNESKLKFLLRDITDINAGLYYDYKKKREEGLRRFGPDSETPDPDMLDRYITLDRLSRINSSFFDTETQIADGSTDMLVGLFPFHLLYSEGIVDRSELIQRAVDGTTRLLRKGGYAIFTTGFNGSEETASEELGIVDIKHAELDKHLRANGLVLKEGPREYNVVESPISQVMRYFEVFAYKKE